MKLNSVFFKFNEKNMVLSSNLCYNRKAISNLRFQAMKNLSLQEKKDLNSCVFSELGKDKKTHFLALLYQKIKEIFVKFQNKKS